MIAAAPVLRDGIDGKAFQNAKGEDMLGGNVKFFAHFES